MQLPHDYTERVYAGVLGKIIGVYLGRPFEGWSYERILRELGEINYYVHEKRGVPLVVTDDDISGTFTFFRALPDHGNSPDISAEQIGQTWLNYLIEKKTILWWGGMGNSTEHTAYLRLKHGIPAPLSGSIEKNGPVVAEQIGGQIFIDCWPMVYPGEPEKAAELARRAASVSHDGEGVYGAQVLAAMESLAFVETDINRLIDTGVSVIPKTSIIYRMIADLRDWHAKDGDWKQTFQRIENQYGYKNFPGNCHMVPNHALIILGLLYGQGDFQKSLMVTNTCGWDTDCNSGNLGCLLGIRNGLAGFDGTVDWRGPVADRIYLPTMDGGRCVSDALHESYQIINAAQAMRALPLIQPKENARFHFELPGSVQGFRVDNNADCAAQVRLGNVPSHSRMGTRSLQVAFTCSQPGTAARVSTPTFILPEDLNMPGSATYALIASPMIYPGQTIHAGLSADEANGGPVEVTLFLNYYDSSNQPARLAGPCVQLSPAGYATLTWTVPELRGMPIYAIGFETRGDETVTQGVVYLDYLTWDGIARTTFERPEGWQVTPGSPNLWSQAWVCAVEHWERNGKEPFRLGQNEGRGLITTGMHEWTDYRVSTTVRLNLMKSGGLVARVQGLQRFYTLQFTEQKTIQLVRVYDGLETVLVDEPFDWQIWGSYALALEVHGERLRGWVDGKLVIDYLDKQTPLKHGALGLAVEAGFMMADAVTVNPV